MQNGSQMSIRYEKKLKLNDKKYVTSLRLNILSMTYLPWLKVTVLEIKES